MNGISQIHNFGRRIQPTDDNIYQAQLFCKWIANDTMFPMQVRFKYDNESTIFYQLPNDSYFITVYLSNANSFAQITSFDISFVE